MAPPDFHKTIDADTFLRDAELSAERLSAIVRLVIFFALLALVLSSGRWHRRSSAAQHGDLLQSCVVLAPAFRTEFTDLLRSWDVPSIRVGGVVLVRAWDWLTDPDDELINASNKNIYSFLKPR